MFAEKMNEKRRRIRGGAGLAATQQVSASEINAMGLFHEVLHFVIDTYVSKANPEAFFMLEDRLKKDLGEEKLSTAQSVFVETFPPTSVYRKEESARDFMARQEGDLLKRHLVLKELILLWLENRNPAFSGISELIDDSGLEKKSAYSTLLAHSDAFFHEQPRFGPAGSPLIKMLLTPIEAHPDSITDQLQFIVENWKDIIGDSQFLKRLLGAIDFIKEEGKYFLMLAQAQADKARMPNVRRAGFEGFGEKGPQPVLRFGSAADAETENFSPDLSWMPRLVLIAKNAFVWLDQLGKKYRRSITRLDQIPDEELEILSRRGFTGLWLIGIWQRSNASQKIKHLNGNWDAIASAYSLNSYDIALDLGGEEGYGNLKDRASRFGIRLASDMVPNHMGVDSTWVIDHPDWFLKSDYPPFPNYSFTGPDISGDERVGIFIEDGYWSKRDAAVVFKRLDRWTGDVRFIYHGNDGTHMPWNDTAQLDFTKPEVREAVIQTILHVARMFSVIRFDAAMVLSKKHYQRLWFPEPGTGGAIPSRSSFSMTKEQFDSVIPVEFWREVVDRVQKEAPDTLLLAEAFWLMEGYFVRTLGMHRVYNSAFMNMLKREENANYRQVIKNVLEYNPQILKRFVNFLNNPDEDTAIAQFGKDDKYFGVCVMMSTMPGLPMFGHGQIEGFTEKYGMEFKRAYRDEHPDEGLVTRHEHEIFPLLRIRHIFSEVDNFLLYDFFSSNGTVNEDVFAYSNLFGEERSLVVYNNRYSQAVGWVRTSVAYRGYGGRLIQRDLADGLAMPAGRHAFCLFRDLLAGLEFIREIKSIRKDGLFIELGAYKFNVFIDFRWVDSSKDMPYDELCRSLDGRGVISIEEELYRIKLKDVHAAFYEAINAGSMKYLMGGLQRGRLKSERIKAYEEKADKLRSVVSKYMHIHFAKRDTSETKHPRYERLLSFQHGIRSKTAANYIARLLPGEPDNSLVGWRVMFLWLFLRELSSEVVPGVKGEIAFERELRLHDQVRNCYAELGVDRATSEYELALAAALASIPLDKGVKEEEAISQFADFLRTDSAQSFLAVHEYDGIRWFNKERFVDLLGHFVVAGAIERTSGLSPDETELQVERMVTSASSLEKWTARAGYRFDDLLAHLSPAGTGADTV